MPGERSVDQRARADVAVAWFQAKDGRSPSRRSRATRAGRSARRSGSMRTARSAAWMSNCWPRLGRGGLHRSDREPRRVPRPARQPGGAASAPITMRHSRTTVRAATRGWRSPATRWCSRGSIATAARHGPHRVGAFRHHGRSTARVSVGSKGEAPRNTSERDREPDAGAAWRRDGGAGKQSGEVHHVEAIGDVADLREHAQRSAPDPPTAGSRPTDRATATAERGQSRSPRG